MEAHVLEWLQLSVRWLHVIAGAAWIGTSFYFNWLNDSFRPPAEKRPGVSGEVWSVHGGAFYHTSKFSVAPGRLPESLHWFKWEAYFTWITGVLLLVLIYYLGSGAFLLEPGVSTIGLGGAVTLGVGTLIVGWLLYDGLCRSPLGRRPSWLAAIVFVVVVATAYGLGTVLSPRAAYIHVGAMMGTWMAANVFFVIIPAQRAMVRALEAGQAPDAERGRQGALRSRHNNYLTLPVLYIMVSNHYPVTYAHPKAWLILAAVLVVGVAARHYYNLRHQGRHRVWLLLAAVVGMVAVVLATLPDRQRSSGDVVRSAERESYAVVRAIVDRRCVTCHSATPSHPTAAVAPLGVELDTGEQLTQYADRVERVVESGLMPLGNLTGMTQRERELLVRWIREGARSE